MIDSSRENPPNGKVVLPSTSRTSMTSKAHISPLAGSEPAQIRQPTLLAVLWNAWKAYSKRAAGYQTGVLFGLVYWLVLGPSSSVARLFGSSLLDLSMKPRATYWLERKPAERTLEALRRQF